MDAESNNLVLITATIAAVASIISIFVNVYLTSTVERRNRLWNKELDRFSELEEKVGILVEDLMAFNCRTDIEQSNFYERMQTLRTTAGRFRRYPEVMKSLRKLSNNAGWYFSQDMKHETKEEFCKIRDNLEESYQELLKAIDQVVKRK